MRQELPKESLVSVVKAAYPAMRKAAIYLLVVALSVSSAIPVQNYKIIVLSALGVLLLFLVFDIHSELVRELTQIRESVTNTEPKPFVDFTDAEDDLYTAIEDALKESPRVDLLFLTIAGSLSWSFLETTVRRLDIKFGKTKTIVIDYGLVRPEYLAQWSLPNWERKAQVTLGNISVFERRYAARIESQQIILRKYAFDNLPHWHGVLINGTVLYLGRTEWEFFADDPSVPPDLLVGQIEYRKFHKNDRFGGERRIARFMNWAERYQKRSKELGEPNVA